jgi:hypothetical protein
MFEPRYGPLVVELPSLQRGEGTLLDPLSPPIRAREPRSESRSIPPAAEPTRPSYAVALANSPIAKSAALTHPDALVPIMPAERAVCRACAAVKDQRRR